jgi:serine/threonine protein kinase
MADGSLERATDLLARMLSLPAEDRPAFLDRECEDDTDLRDLVTELADLDDDAAAYFDELTDDIVAVADLEIDSAARPARHVGPYVILESIGHGGMGAVFRARRVDGAFDHEVALKLLHLDMETPQMRARFIAERQLLAHLQHPNIATLFDGGVTDEGRPFFAMELIDGQPVTIHCAEQQLPMEKVLGLMLDVIEAVSYLHRNLVVHRDLKPSNILVDRDGRVKLLDFGIAKLLSEEPEGGGFTRTGEVLMTPNYAAPEQRLGRPVTTAADVYSLGIVLYELLTGQRPTGTGAPAAPVEGRTPEPTQLHPWSAGSIVSGHRSPRPSGRAMASNRPRPRDHLPDRTSPGPRPSLSLRRTVRTGHRAIPAGTADQRSAQHLRLPPRQARPSTPHRPDRGRRRAGPTGRRDGPRARASAVGGTR